MSYSASKPQTSYSKINYILSVIYVGRLSSKQRSLYNRILDSPEVEAVIQNRIVPFRALNALRKLCNHPSMLTADDTSLTDTLQEKLKRNKLQKLSSKIRNPSSSVSDKRAPISRRDDFQRIDCERSDSDSDGASAIYRSASLKWEDSGKLLVLVSTFNMLL